MRIPTLLYLVTFICALSEIGMGLHAAHWNDVVAELNAAALPKADSEMTILRALNIALPIGVATLLVLLRMRKTADFSGFALWLVAGLHLWGVNLNLDAADTVFGAKAPLETLAWWAPASNP